MIARLDWSPAGRDLLRGFGWVEATTLAFWGACAVGLLFAESAGRPPSPEGSRSAALLAVGGLASGFLVVSFVRARARPGGVAAAVLRVVQVAGTFALGHTVVGLVSRALSVPRIDAWLARADLALFGGFPAVSVQAWNSAPLVDWLYVAYVSFYFLPLPLYIVLLVRGRAAAAESYVLAVHFSVQLCFLGYLLLPAATPVALAAAGGDSLVRFDAPLPRGALSFGVEAFLAGASSNRFDAFPSGHVTTTLTALFLAWQTDRRTALWLLPVGVSIVYATLALRFHFAVDLLAGLALAVTAISLARAAGRPTAGLDTEASARESASRGCVPARQSLFVSIDDRHRRR